MREVLPVLFRLSVMMSLLLVCLDCVPQPGFASSIFKNMMNEIELITDSYAEYRNKVETSLKIQLNKFVTDIDTNTHKAIVEVETYRERLSNLYNDSKVLLDRQKKILDSLNEITSSRPKGIDESLEKFRQYYANTSTFTSKLPSSFPASKGIFASYYSRMQNRFKRKDDLYPGDFTGIKFKDSFYKSSIESLNSNFKVNYNILMESLSKFYGSTEQVYKTATVVEDLNKYQADLTEKARYLYAQFLSTSSYTNNNKVPVVDLDPDQQDSRKRELQEERLLVSQQIKSLTDDGMKFINDQKRYLETQIKKVQSSMTVISGEYDELINKRKASLYYTSLNDANLNRVLDLIDMKKEAGWEHIKEEKGINVYRKFIAGIQGRKSRYACVMCNGIINSPVVNVLDIFTDDSRIPEYNAFYESGKNLEVVAENTKVQWACTHPVFPFKPRDFVTLIHIRKLKDGTCVVLNTAIDHKSKPPSKEYVRGQIILAANIIQPITGNKKKCNVTMLTQMDPGGFAPAPAVNRICEMGPPGYMANLELAAKRSLNGKKRIKAALQ
jgi:hypothetical protein